MCTIEGGLNVVVSSVDTQKYILKYEDIADEDDKIAHNSSEESKEENAKAKEEEDSVFGDEEAETVKKTQEMYLEEIENGTHLKKGSTVMLQIKDIVVSEGTLISYATLL